MMQVVHSRFNALLSASFLSLVATVAWSQSLTWLGVLPGYNYSLAIDVSADGSVVVGKSYNDAAGYQGLAFRWTRDGGMQNLGTLPGYNYSWATGVSADGRIVVGRTWKRESPIYSRGYRWTAENGMEDLGTLPGGSWSDALDITPDGSYISVSAIDPSTGDWHLCRWTAGGGLERLVAERVFWWPGRFSADGTVMAGQANWRGYALRAYRWVQGMGAQDLGTLGGSRSSAYDVSADGSVVVGWADNAAGQLRAFRWTASGGMQDLGTLGGNESCAAGVLADGAVVVGWAKNAAGQQRAFRWTAARGMEDLNTTYASLLTDGSVLWSASAISPDGRYIVGYGYNAATGRSTEAFLLDTRCTAHNGDVDNNGCIDDADLLAVLFAFGNAGSNLGRVDVNCDGVVDDADLLQVLFNFGSGC